MKPSSELKANARVSLTGRYAVLIGALLLSRLITVLLANIFAQTADNTLAAVIDLASTLILALLTSLLDAGLTYMYLSAARNEKPALTDLFHWFTHYPDKVLVIALSITGINLLLAAPFLAAVYLLLQQTYGSSALDVLVQAVSRPAIPLLPAGSAWILLGLMLLWLVLAISVNLRYTMVYYLLADDPEDTPARLLAKSRRLMQGSRLRLCGLMLSFAGLLLLTVLTLGLGLLWLSPYLSMTISFYYLNLRTAADIS